MTAQDEFIAARTADRDLIEFDLLSSGPCGAFAFNSGDLTVYILPTATDDELFAECFAFRRGDLLDEQPKMLYLQR